MGSAAQPGAEPDGPRAHGLTMLGLTLMILVLFMALCPGA